MLYYSFADHCIETGVNPTMVTCQNFLSQREFTRVLGFSRVKIIKRIDLIRQSRRQLINKLFKIYLLLLLLMSTETIITKISNNTNEAHKHTHTHTSHNASVT